MEAYDTLKSRKNSLKGFTLLEVMVAGALILIFMLLGSSMVSQGVQQLIEREKILNLVNHIDEWSRTVKQQGYFSEGLSVGGHQMEVKDSKQNVYTLQWNVQQLNSKVKGLSFSLQDPSNREILHEWKSGLSN